MIQPKVWLCGITSSGKEDNLRTLIEPVIEHFAGLQWTFHYPKDSGADYLESRAGEGRIIYAHYSQRHGSSMTQYLYQGTMQDGDYFIQIDDLERISPQFCYEKLPQLIALMKEADLAMIANYGKGLVYRYNEQLEFRGSPHWYAVGLDGAAINIELEKNYFWNIRNEKRPKDHFINHYMRYYLFPAGSNSALLGLDTYSDPNITFPIREKQRLEFRKEMKARGYNLNLDGIKLMFSQPLDSWLKEQINSEKVLNDWYRYYILNKKDIIDSHFPSDIKIIP